VALVTVPVTFAPVKEVKPEPLPVITPEPVFNVPDTFTPVPVIIKVVLPTAVMFTLPFAAGIATFEFPFACVPNKLPTKVVAVMALFAIFALIPVTFSSATLPLADVEVPAKYTVVFTDVLLNTAAAFVAEVALVAVPDNEPTNVVAVILLFAKFALMPDTVFNA
jgi:hypothetical protein